MEFIPSELMAVSGARELKEGQVVAVGIDLPTVASFLAKKTHAPNMTLLFELSALRTFKYKYLLTYRYFNGLLTSET